MADAVIQVPPDSTGKLVDNTSLSVASQTVHRQRGNVSSPSDPVGLAEVRSAVPSSADYGLVTREAPVGLTEVLIDTASSGDLTVVSAVGGKIIKVWKLYLRANGNTTITIKDSTPTNMMGAMDFAQGGDLLLPKDSDPWITCAVGKGFVLNNSAAIQLSGRALVTQV